MLVGGGELHDRWETLVARADAAVARDPALHRDHAGDGRPGAARRGRAARARAADGAAGCSSRTRRVRPARAAPGVRARRRRLAGAAGAVHGRARAALRAAACASAGSRRSPARWASTSRSSTARCPTPRRARACSARCSGGCARTRTTIEDALAATRPARPRRVRAGGTDGGRSLRGARKRRPDVSGLPDEPGVYVFRNAQRPAAVRRQVGRRCARARGRTSRRRRRRRTGRCRPSWSTTARRARSSARCCSSAG